MLSEDVIQLIVANISPKQRHKLRIGVLVSGGGSNLQALYDYSSHHDSFFELAVVIANKASSYALTRAGHMGLPHHLVAHRDHLERDNFERLIIDALQAAEAELVVCAGFLRVLSENFLARFLHRVINLHPSLLPKYPGLHAIEKALLAQDHMTGCTVHLVDHGLDTGPMIAQAQCPILADDDLPALNARIQKLEHSLLPRVVNHIAKSVITRDCV